MSSAPTPRGGGFPRRVDLPGVAKNGAHTVDLGAFELGARLTNTAPIIVTGPTVSMPDGQVYVIDVETTDDFHSEGAGLTYAKTGGADATLFDLDAVSGVLTFGSAPDFDNPQDDGADSVYEVQVTVTDWEGLSDIQDVIVTVLNNTPPVITSAAAASASELQIAAIDVETTDDFDTEGAGLTYAKTGGADAALFDLDTFTGVLTFGSAPDFENPADSNADNDYEVQVTVMDADGLTNVQDITITVTDIPETAFEVTTTDDERDDLDGLGTISLENFGGADDLSLREALALANQDTTSVDTITFASSAGAVFAGGGTIRLAQALGELVLWSDVIINGDTDGAMASRNVTIDAESNSGVLNVTGGSSTIDGLVITGGGLRR